MHHVKKKIARIVDELITFFYAVGGSDFDIKVREDDEMHAIFFRSDFDPAYTEKIEKLCDYLKKPRSPAVEEMYWGLAGDGDLESESEMLLIGAMIDEAEVKFSGNQVTFYLYRNREN